jgi:hypothetical protein
MRALTPPSVLPVVCSMRRRNSWSLGWRPTGGSQDVYLGLKQHELGGMQALCCGYGGRRFRSAGCFQGSQSPPHVVHEPSLRILGFLLEADHRLPRQWTGRVVDERVLPFLAPSDETIGQHWPELRNLLDALDLDVPGRVDAISGQHCHTPGADSLNTSRLDPLRLQELLQLLLTLVFLQLAVSLSPQGWQTIPQT